MPELTERAIAEISSMEVGYRDGTVPPAEMRVAAEDNMRLILAVLSGRPVPRELADSPAATGRRRAEQHLPLESLLRSFQVDFRVLWEAFIDEARQSSDSTEALFDAVTEVWRVVDSMSATVVTSYRAAEVELSRLDLERRYLSFDRLIDGPVSAAIAAQAASVLSLPLDGLFVVMVCDATDDGHALRVERVMREAGLETRWRRRGRRLIGIVASDGEKVTLALAAVPVRAGVSPPFRGLGGTASAVAMADLALSTLPAGSHEAVRLDDVYPEALLMSGGPLAARLRDDVLGPILALRSVRRDRLLATLRCYFGGSGSVGEIARAMRCHRNTVIHHLDSIEQLTGRSLRQSADVIELGLAVLALDLPLTGEGDTSP